MKKLRVTSRKGGKRSKGVRGLEGGMSIVGMISRGKDRQKLARYGTFEEGLFERGGMANETEKFRPSAEHSAEALLSRIFPVTPFHAFTSNYYHRLRNKSPSNWMDGFSHNSFVYVVALARPEQSLAAI